jgi:hypothetical protein
MKIRAAGLIAVAALLSGCGGGIYIGFGGSGDSPPDVSLVAGVTSAAPGQAVPLAAAASDDYAVDRVDFYRVDAGGGATWLGTDPASPYQWNAAIPVDAASGSTVLFFARAIDDAGQQTDSTTVAVSVL